MPRYGSADIPHTAATDHRIFRDPTAPDAAAFKPPSDGLPLVSFYHGRPGLDDAEDERSRAVALVVLARGRDAAALRSLHRFCPRSKLPCSAIT